MTSTSPDFNHRFVPSPVPDASRTLLLLHGTGGDENDLLALGRELDPQSALLSPRGKVLENGMPRFFRRLEEGIFDQEDLRLRTRELAEFVGKAAEQYGFDPKEVVAVGYSNGANIAASLLLAQTGVLKSAVLFHPMIPLVPATTPNLKGISVFIGAGQTDPIVPVSQTTGLAELLETAGADVTLHWQPGGHNLSQNELQAARAWLAAE